MAMAYGPRMEAMRRSRAGPATNRVMPGPSGFVHTDAGGTRCGTCEYLKGRACTNPVLNRDNAAGHFLPVAGEYAQVDPRNDCCNEWEHKGG